jgi:hypothetical protein
MIRNSLSSNTHVFTYKKTYVPIKNVKPGDKLLNYRGDISYVRNIKCKKYTDCIKITHDLWPHPTFISKDQLFIQDSLKDRIFELPIDTCPKYLKKLNSKLANLYGIQNVHIYDVPDRFIYVVKNNYQITETKDTMELYQIEFEKENSTFIANNIIFIT